MIRMCGSCDVCCVVGAVPEIGKPEHSVCRYASTSKDGCCSLFGKPERPSVCNSFQCVWKHGLGREEDRPDKIGVLLSVNNINGGAFVFAIEQQEDAVRTTGRHLTVLAAQHFKLPLIVIDHDAVPPRDVGDRVVINRDLTKRAASMLGASLGSLAEGVDIYELKV